jgi:hypothetical protein
MVPTDRRQRGLPYVYLDFRQNSKLDGVENGSPRLRPHNPLKERPKSLYPPPLRSVGQSFQLIDEHTQHLKVIETFLRSSCNCISNTICCLLPAKPPRFLVSLLGDMHTGSQRAITISLAEALTDPGSDWPQRHCRNQKPVRKVV